uniref:Nuclear pore complex protein Nup214 n=1 Tax=Nothobranchius furzeri TaxID=105023 RepID=A0A8C6K794_NOTFU
HRMTNKDFKFRQMKKVQVFEPAEELPKDRSSLLTVSNKYGLTFVGLDRTFKVIKSSVCLTLVLVKGMPVLSAVTVGLNLHHLALSCDELTLSVCGESEETGLFISFYDVRTFMNKARPQKLPFASLQPAVDPGTLVQDLKWNPAQTSMLAACLSDGSMMILDVTDVVKVQAQLPPTSVSWSPKGKQVAAGKMNATVSQYTPALEEKKVIPPPHFYTSDEPVKALDVIWLRTFVFAVVYAAADGCLETPPDLVLISIPKKDEKVETKYLNFGDSVYGSCTERQHHYFLSHIEDWDLLFAASAASIEVSVMARQDEKMWELWILEDASRAELPVTETNEDTLPLGLAMDFTSQQEIQITDEKTLPPAPTMLMLSTEGLLCPFSLLNENPGVKQLVAPPVPLALEGERQPKPAASSAPAPAAAAPSSTPLFSVVPTAPVSSSSSAFAFSVPTTFSTASITSTFPLGGSAPLGLGSSSFSVASNTPPAPSTFSFSTPPIKLPAASASTPQNLSAASPPAIKLNLNERYGTTGLFSNSSCLCCQIAHFQKELDDLKARSAKADFKVGSNDEMKELRKESEDLHIFTLEIKETTESLHGDIGTLKTTLLEGFAGAEDAKTQSELSKDRNYRQLLYKKPLDPRSEEQLKEIRMRYQYVTFAVEDVNDVLDVEWEKHLEKKKQKHMVVPGREGLFTTLSNNLYIINQQKNRLDQLVQELTSLRLYSKAAPSRNQNAAVTSSAGLQTELENLKDALLKARLNPEMFPGVKISPAKQSQLRNFLSKGQMPPVRSTAPANLSRSAFLSPKYYEDLDDASSTSSLAQSLEEELQPLQPPLMTAMAPALSIPRHQTVVRTPSIQPGFGAIQSTPLPKIQSLPSIGFGVSPIVSPIPSNKINLSGAESTALATKTVKHGAPPAERTVPITMSAPQAAATAAMRRQMANQKAAAVSTSLTESTLKMVPQVVNVQELKDKGPAAPASSINRFLLPFFTVKDVNKFTFRNGKAVFGQSGDPPFSLIQKPTSSGLGTGSPTLASDASVEPGKLPSTTSPPAPRVEPQPAKLTGGETLGIFSGLRVGQGEEAKDAAPNPVAEFTLGEAGIGLGVGAQQFSFSAADLSKGAAPNSLFKPPESTSKPAFSVPPSDSVPSTLPTSFSSLVTPSSEEPKAPPQPSEPTPPPEEEPTTSDSTEDSTSQSVAPEPAPNAVTMATPAASTPAVPVITTVSTLVPLSTFTAPAEAVPPPPVSAPSTTEAPPDSSTTTPVSTSPAASVAPDSQSRPAAFQVPPSEKPGSIFTQSTPATTDTAPAATTITPSVSSGTPTTTAAVFGQPVAPPASSAPAPTAFSSSGFGATTGTGFGKSVFGQNNLFAQPSSNSGSASSFSFTQSGFGATSSSGTTGGGGLFGSATASNASSFSFGASGANTAPTQFGQSTTLAFGQSSGFGQGPVFGSNTTTPSSSGFSFSQPSGEPSRGFGCPAAPVFGQQSSSSSAGTAGGAAGGGGFFSGLGGKPSEDAANKNPFGSSPSAGAFGQATQTGSNSLFGNSGAKAFGFGQSAFGDQKSTGTFSTSGGSVASQGFGSFSSPTKSGGFGNAPVFGSPPSFGGTPAFGGGAAFGSSPSFSNPMGPSASKVFGEGTAASNMGGFGFASAPSGPSFGSIANQSGPSFGSLAQQGPGFGSQPSSFSGFGQQPQPGGETSTSQKEGKFGYKGNLEQNLKPAF